MDDNRSDIISNKAYDDIALSLQKTSHHINKILPQKAQNTWVLFDMQQQISTKYNIDELPTTVIIDRDGIIRFVHSNNNEIVDTQIQQELLQVTAEQP